LEGLAFTAHSLEGIARLITAQQPTNKFVDVAVGWRTSANRLLVALFQILNLTVLSEKFIEEKEEP
jgi:hypothetical protein